MGNLFKLAWRNVWRNRRRSFLTMGAILFSVIIITLTRSLQTGTYDVLESQAIRLVSGDMQIQHRGFNEEPSLNLHLSEDALPWASMLEQPWVYASARRIQGAGLLSADNGSAGAMVLGIEPELERRVTLFGQRATRGELLMPGDRVAAVLGDQLARNLQVVPGDTVAILTQGYRGALGAELYAVKGTIQTGSTELDRALMLLTLEDAQELFSMPGGFTQVVLRTTNFREADTNAQALASQIDDENYAVLDWDTLMPELRQMIVLDNASNLIFIGFLVILLWFEIVNTTSMSVMERMRELGVMQAVGMRPRDLAGLVFIELTIKIVLGLLVGLVVAGAMVWYLKDVVIRLPAEVLKMYENFGMAIDGIYFGASTAMLIEPVVAVGVAALLAIVYPVVRVLRLEPARAMRRPV